MISTNITRTKAFLSHLLLSLVILAVLSYLLTQHWYPGVFFHIDGGMDGLKLILGCDIILGPVLTLIVFKQGKKRLWLDLTIIGIVQFGALTAGTWIVYKERPLAIAYSNDRFVTLLRGNFEFLNLPIPNFDKFPGTTPKALFVDLPEDRAARRATQKASEIPVYVDAKRYKPLAPNWQKAISWGGRSVEEMIQTFPFAEAEIQAWLTAHGRSADDTMMIAVSASASWRYLYVDRFEPKILGVASRDLAPGV